MERILTAVDGSEHALKAVALAADLAAKYGARLVILNVREHTPVPEELRRMAETEHMVEGGVAAAAAVSGAPSISTSARFGTDQEALDARIRAAMSEKIVEQAGQVAHDHGATDIKTVAAEGNPAREIVDCAKRESADLIVLGSRGLGDLKGLLLGSVSHKVAHLATCTCVTVK